MIKRLIFDLDDTLIPFRKEYMLRLYEVYLKYMDKEIPDLMHTMYLITEKYDATCIYYNKEDYLTLINKELGIHLDTDFMDDLLDTMSSFVMEEDKKISNTLEYLSSKYELVILTNWFRDVQIKRLEKLDILKYFKEIYTCDVIKRKPYDESYMTAKGKFETDACVMIGDSYIHDIKRAHELGFKTVYLTKNKDNKIKEADYIIDDICELSNLF